MKRIYCMGAALAALVVAAPAAAQVTVAFAPGSGVTPGFNVFEDFEDEAVGASLGTNAAVFDGSVSGIAARPAFGSTGNFGAVLGVPTFGSATFSFAPTSSFGFVLGSIDTYNTLTLFFEGGGSQAYVGGQIMNDLSFPSGNQIVGETNGFVSYTSTGARIVGAQFQSTANSFEFDNLAAAVPEPATWGMMILGFGAVGAAVRRRRLTTRFLFA